jgi:predicted phosphate transport protein (TIGR00153 family)
MRLGLGPRTSEVYDLLGAAGKAVLEVAQLVERRFREWPNGPSQEEVKALEHEADRVVSELLVNVNAQFVTPYDRDDLVRLAFVVDDVADAAENAAELLGLYGIVTPTKQSLELVGLLVRACEHLATLLAGLHERKDSQAGILAIKAVEDEADVVARAARASLFKDDAIDPMIVIRWKGIYEALEDAVDACETAAHRVGNILVKNA